MAMMIHRKKQLKITKLFRKSGAKTKHPEEHEELLKEIQQLQQKLQEKQQDLFQIQRNSHRHKHSPLSQKKAAETFTRPQTIVLKNAVSRLRRNMELMTMMSSTEVQSYVAGDHCSVVFHMQHPAEFQVKHGLRIDMNDGVNQITASSLPLGFNINTVLDDFSNVMKPECLEAVRKALVAYYDRLEQYHSFKNLVKLEAQIFKTLDGSHVEVSFFVKDDEEEEDDLFHVTLLFDYRVYDIRPKNYAVKELDFPEGAADILREQCAIFKKKPLHKAFKELFMDGVCRYKLVQQVCCPRPVQHKQLRPNNHQHNDDTFLPEHCSDQGEDESEV